jgi:hypothetical protein
MGFPWDGNQETAALFDPARVMLRHGPAAGRSGPTSDGGRRRRGSGTGSPKSR